MPKGTVKTRAKSGTAPAVLVLNPPTPARQVRFHQLLVAARRQWFIDALSEALSRLDQNVVKEQIREYVPGDAQRILAVAGLRDESVFPVPAVIEIKPSLVGYYRLLLGAPQKSFYKGSTGMGRFKSMEESGTLTEKVRQLVPNFCHAMAIPLAELVRQIPKITERDLHELPLLTFGSQLQGSNNTLIGKTAMKDVFVAIKEIVARYIVAATDPDVSVREQVSDHTHLRVAIEVKGGTDVSNAHNRAGEAEKSHQKARRVGFPEFWTIISKRDLELSKLRSESPTTNHWFDVVEVLARSGGDWDDFRQRLAGVCGIPVVDSK